MIPMLNLRREYLEMKADIDFAIRQCLEHQRWIGGEEVTTFEQAAAKYLGVKHCIGVSSGTDALVLALKAMPGGWQLTRYSEIVTTPFTFIATADAILRAGATPVFVDIDLMTFNLSVDAAAACRGYTSGAVVGIVPVHLFGQSCDMTKIARIVKSYDVGVCEDAAQAFGASYEGFKLGTIGPVSAFSFFPSKNLGCYGDGGMCATNDDKTAELIRKLAQHGGKTDSNYLGYNARLDTIQAAILQVKLQRIDEFNARRQQVARWYQHELDGVGELVLPKAPEGVQHVYHQYTIRVKAGKRDALQEHLKKHEIASAVYYRVPLHKMRLFDGACKIGGSLENAERACEEVLSLPIGPTMTRSEVAQVGNTIRQFYE